MRRWSLLSALVALVLTAHAAFAQKDKKEPRRPHLDTQADTNEARAYYAFGLQQLRRDPEQAADGFYWATRLNPAFADAYYARRCALLLSDRYRFQKYYEDDRRTLQSDEIKRIDSLYLYSLTINPFLYRKLEQDLLHTYLDIIADDIARRDRDVSASDLRYQMNVWLMQAPPSFKAEQAYGEGRFQQALELYAQAIKQSKQPALYRTYRGRLFFQLDHADSALAELSLALDDMRKADKKDLVYVYMSKANMEHSIGLVQQRLGNTGAAKEAFARALQEDLSYFPAHVQLAYMALDAKDTTTALSEMDLAVQIRGDDPMLRYTYGYALALTGKYKDAEAQLSKAIDLDPVFAAPYYALGETLDQEGKQSEALAQYQAFLAHASKTDLRRADADQRVKSLTVKSGQ